MPALAGRVPTARAARSWARFAGLTALLVLALSLAACGGGSEGSSERRVRDACRLVTEDDAERIFGAAPVKLPTPQARTAAVHVCIYREPKAGLQLVVRSVETPDSAGVFQSLAQTGRAEPVPNLGREAVLLDQSSLVVLVDDTMRLEVSVTAAGQLDRGRTVAAAETALRRLAEE